MVKPTDATLNNLLGSRQFLTADLITVTLNNGSTLHYCSGESDIIFNGSTYTAGGIGSTAGGPFWDRKDNKAKVVWKIGTGHDSLTIDVIPGAAQVGNMSFLNAVRTGVFDNADFLLQRAFMATYGTLPSTNCAVTMFQGMIGTINADRAIATFQIDDYRNLFNQQMPKWLFAPTCQNTLYDSNCTLSASANASTGVVSAGSSQSNYIISTSAGITSQSVGWFDNGKLSFTSGANSGLSFAVNMFTFGAGVFTISLTSPTPFSYSLGDSFLVYPGCDRSTGTGGCGKAWLPSGSNIVNFRGMPYIPDPGTAF